MSTPRFTVVIPTYRRPDSLAHCLDLLAAGAQTHPADDYEVVVTDDEKSDRTTQKLVETRYPAVRWVDGPGRGPAANRNCGAAYARGSWLIFTDDDCLPQPGWIAAFAARIEAAGETCRVFEGRTDPGVDKIRPFEQAPVNEAGGLLWSCNFAIERGLFERMGGFDARFPYPHLEDVDFRLRLDDQRERYDFVPEARVVHPPRPVGSALQWVRGQESSFYLASKRGVPLTAVNFGVGGYLRGCAQALRAGRGVGDFVRVSWRIAEEVALLGVFLPLFLLKYRKKEGKRQKAEGKSQN